MNVLVNGVGNIGTTILNFLCEFQKELGITEIFACKRTISDWNSIELEILKNKGVKICTTGDDRSYPQLGMILPQINYIFEATANSVGLQNKQRYESLPHLIGACAQGSEKGFGVSFMSGVNNEVIEGSKFVHIVSCNTHGTASLLQLFCGDNLEQLESADVVVVRRSEDIGNHQRLVAANVVARHLDPQIGTHHAIDVVDLFKTKNINCKVTSSDVTTPSQMMHAVRFNIKTKNSITKDKLHTSIKQHPLISTTEKFDSNVVFELGRRYGLNGRIYSHSIVIENNIQFTDNEVKGWAFVPQEGNSILSTLHAFLLQTKHPQTEMVFQSICNKVLRKEW